MRRMSIEDQDGSSVASATTSCRPGPSSTICRRPQGRARYRGATGGCSTRASRGDDAERPRGDRTHRGPSIPPAHRRTGEAHRIISISCRTYNLGSRREPAARRPFISSRGPPMRRAIRVGERPIDPRQVAAVALPPTALLAELLDPAEGRGIASYQGAIGQHAAHALRRRRPASRRRHHVVARPPRRPGRRTRSPASASASAAGISELNTAPAAPPEAQAPDVRAMPAQVPLVRAATLCDLPARSHVRSGLYEEEAFSGLVTRRRRCSGRTRSRRSRPLT